jgi:hypothetical protein
MLKNENTLSFDYNMPKQKGGGIMSWMEYNNMWEKAQKEGKYKLYVLDIKDSRKQGYFYPFINLFLYRVYFKIKDLENEYGHKILHTSPIFNKGDRGDLSEPFFFMGDLLGFTVLRGTISDDEVYQIMKDVKAELQIPYQFHYGSGYYETDNYNEGAEKYFRGYCMCYIEHQIKNNHPIQLI